MQDDRSGYQCYGLTIRYIQNDLREYDHNIKTIQKSG